MESSSSTQGFRSGTTGNYSYDYNSCPPPLNNNFKWRGNMRSDASKNITSIIYNHLNLPRTFTFSGGNMIEMNYDASGMKLSKVVKQGATVASRMHYIKGIEYRNSKLQAIYHSEGRVAYTDATQSLSITTPINGETKTFKAGTIIASNINTGNANVTMQASTNIQFLPGFFVDQGSNFLGNMVSAAAATSAYEYVIRDHLGNGRIYFTDYNGNSIVEESNGEILQESHYDPWGFALGGAWVNNSAVNNFYQYNASLPDRQGKELNNDHGLGLYDYGARWYDAGIGRWTSVDPMADKRAWVSPYNYVQNNPILRTDPSGAIDGIGDPVQPSVAGIILEKILQAEVGIYNTVMRIGETLGFGTPGQSTRASVKYGDDNAILGIEKSTSASKGIIAETLSAAGDLLAITPIGGAAKGLSTPVLMAKTPSKNGIVNAMKAGEEGSTFEKMAKPGFNRPGNNKVQNKQFDKLSSDLNRNHALEKE